MNKQRNTTTYNEHNTNYALICQYKRQLKLEKPTHTTHKRRKYDDDYYDTDADESAGRGGGYDENTHNTNR